MFVEFCDNVMVVGVFICLLICLVNVLDCQVKNGKVSEGCVVIFVNFGNLNVFIGSCGVEVVIVLFVGIVVVLGIDLNCVFIFFIGVIGEFLFYDWIMFKFDELVGKLSLVGIEEVVKVIMIIDIFFKGYLVEIEVDGKFVKIVGIVKGLGMIVLDMVMMFVYIFIDVLIGYDQL